MITLEPIGFVRSSRGDLSDDNWGAVTARIELAESLPAESLDGIESFSHGEVVYYFDRVPDAEVELLDTGHFALEEDLERIAGSVRRFLGENVGEGAPGA